MAQALDHIILEHNGVKIGVIGLAEEEWLDCIMGMEEDDYTFEDFIESGKKWSKKLKEEEGCEVVIALTHMRLPNDEKLAEAVEDIDIILGGHDHCSEVQYQGKNLLVKSGSDFREFSIIEVKIGCSEETLASKPDKCFFKPEKNMVATWEKVEVTKDFEPDQEMKDIIDSYWKELSKKLEQVAGVTGVDLDARFEQIRQKETNICNFVADVVNFSLRCDVALLNTGSFRADEIIPKGIIKWKDIDTLFPILDDIVVIRVKGENLLAALENGVSEVPKLEGRFPAISGCRIKYDSTRPKMERIIEAEVNGEPLDKEKYYKVCTKVFLYKGKDGFDPLTDGELCYSEHDDMTVNNALINFLRLMTRSNKVWFSKKRHLVEKALKMCNNDTEEYVTEDDQGNKLDYKFYKFYPKVDGRLTDVSESE